MTPKPPKVGQTYKTYARDRVTVTKVSGNGRVTFADSTRSYTLATPVFMACAKLIVRPTP